MSGTLALVGGGEWTDGCTFDRELLAIAGSGEVVIVPAGAAFENPSAVVERARSWFARLGATVVEVPVLTRSDGLVEEHVTRVREARFIYLPGSSPMHLRSVLKDSPLYDAMVDAWREGAVLAGSGAGADVLCDPMVDTRGGAFTVGLGLVPGLAVIPRCNQWSHEKIHRTVELAPRGVALVGVPEATALIRDPDGSWRVSGVGDCLVYRDGRPADLSALPALPRL
ncbi:MAG: Type 1 glutamine amidotransferase-like domain-containing protein [Acidimicrobiales bacterium]